MKDPRPKVHSRTAFNQRNIYQPPCREQPTNRIIGVWRNQPSPFKRLTISEHGRVPSQPTAAALLPCRMWQLQDWRNDSTGCATPIRPLVNEKSSSGERSGANDESSVRRFSGLDSMAVRAETCLT